MIQEINQVLTINMLFIEAQPLLIIDYGTRRNTILFCTSFEDRKIKHFDSNQIAITKNNTMNFNIK
jgi:hypothetical protein